VCDSALEWHSFMSGDCNKVTCEDCTVFVNALWGRVDELFPYVASAR
jgi:hypothetical protein